EVRAELARIGVECGDVTVHTSAERDIGEVLLSVIDEVEASLMVIGLRRKPPLGQLNLGASARRVVVGAPCPVLAVKDVPLITAAARSRSPPPTGNNHDRRA